jgi:hypothetical protein
MRIAQDPRATDVRQDGSQILITVRAASEPADLPIPIEAEALARYGLEERPVRRLAEIGRLQYRTIGRRRVTTLRWLLEAIYALPARALEPDDDVAAAASKRAARGSR